MLCMMAGIPHLTLYIEMGYDQADLARAACQARDWDCELFPDPAGILRFAKITVI